MYTGQQPLRRRYFSLDQLRTICVSLRGMDDEGATQSYPRAGFHNEEHSDTREPNDDADLRVLANVSREFAIDNT